MQAPELDFTMNFEDGQQSEADRKLVVAFYKGAIKNEFKSTEAGRPIFDEVNLVKIITPGSRDSFIGDATEQYQQRFPQQWARFKAGQDQDLSGTPLSVLPWLGIGQIAELQAVNCHTVEHLAGMSDALAQKFMGAHAIRARAQQYLEISKANAPGLKMESELQKRDDQIAELKATVEKLLAAKADESKAKVTPK